MSTIDYPGHTAAMSDDRPTRCVTTSAGAAVGETRADHGRRLGYRPRGRRGFRQGRRRRRHRLPERRGRRRAYRRPDRSRQADVRSRCPAIWPSRPLPNRGGRCRQALGGLDSWSTTWPSRIPSTTSPSSRRAVAANLRGQRRQLLPRHQGGTGASTRRRVDRQHRIDQRLARKQDAHRLLGHQRGGHRADLLAGPVAARTRNPSQLRGARSRCGHR